ncbi:hypothetical protein L2E82_50147 [Cichorium intybus]|nr:hypothetical protein L2E82_50147 [Cichorium intybus]
MVVRQFINVNIREYSLLDSISLLSNIPEINVESNEVLTFSRTEKARDSTFSFVFVAADRPSTTRSKYQRKIRSDPI